MSNSVFQANASQAFEMRRKASFSKLAGVVPRSMAGMYVDSGSPSEAGKAQPPISSQKSKIWHLMNSYTGTDQHTIQQRIVNHVEYTLACTRFNFNDECCYRATAYSIRDRLIETLKDTNSYLFDKDAKRCYYLSLEFLVGRAMQNALVNLDIEDNYKKALADMGYSLEALYEYEHDAALGNGGLGRLAACFLDSMATLNYPCWGYGIRYNYGIFEQKIVDGRQVEHPDYWLVQDNPWEIQRPDITYAVRFYGDVEDYKDDQGRKRHRWVGGELVQAVAYDNPIPGFDTYNCINLRLWKATPSKEFDFKSFDSGKYLEAVQERQDAESISAVLYPNDNTEEGKILRLKQQYFFCCATIQDVLRRFRLKGDRKWADLPKKMAIQLNDTHPTIAIPELMRILVDIQGLDWEEAWDITKRVFNYTNHTVLPEALEKWPVQIFEKLLPRHLLIINEINFRFLNEVRGQWGDCWDVISRLSIYEEGYEKKIRMANLAVIGSSRVNGVAFLHSELVKRDLFPEFGKWYAENGQPDKFLNITNGVTPRRWMYCANRPLSNLISEWLGSDSWLKDLDMLKGLLNHIDDAELLKLFDKVKLRNKKRLAKWVELNCGVVLDAERMLFDVQVKRIHEYKRQLLNALYILYRYLHVKKLSQEQKQRILPRASLLGGKAAPGYAKAKTIIKLVNNIAKLVNEDNDVNDLMKVAFLPNYNVSNAQIIIPGADLNHQISTAGMEASGTGNMKFVMNGSLIIGTLDGANVEIREECGNETMFLFGAREDEVGPIREKARSGNYAVDRKLREVFDFIKCGNVSFGDAQTQKEFDFIIDGLTNNGFGTCSDHYLVCYDFPDFVRANEEVDATYQDRSKWNKLCIQAAASMGKFTADRTISEYAKLIWDIQACERPANNPEKSVPSAYGAPGHCDKAPVMVTRPTSVLAAEAVAMKENTKGSATPVENITGPEAQLSPEKTQKAENPTKVECPKVPAEKKEVTAENATAAEGNNVLV